MADYPAGPKLQNPAGKPGWIVLLDTGTIEECAIAIVVIVVNGRPHRQRTGEFEESSVKYVE